MSNTAVEECSQQEDSIQAAVREATKKTQERLAAYQRKQAAAKAAAAAAEKSTASKARQEADATVSRLQTLAKESKKLTTKSRKLNTAPANSQNAALPTTSQQQAAPLPGFHRSISLDPNAVSRNNNGHHGAITPKGKRLSEIFQTLGSSSGHGAVPPSPSLNRSASLENVPKQLSNTTGLLKTPGGNKGKKLGALFQSLTPGGASTSSSDSSDISSAAGDLEGVNTGIPTRYSRSRRISVPSVAPLEEEDDNRSEEGNKARHKRSTRINEETDENDDDDEGGGGEYSIFGMLGNNQKDYTGSGIDIAPEDAEELVEEYYQEKSKEAQQKAMQHVMEREEEMEESLPLLEALMNTPKQNAAAKAKVGGSAKKNKKKAATATPTKNNDSERSLPLMEALADQLSRNQRVAAAVAQSIATIQENSQTDGGASYDDDDDMNSSMPQLAPFETPKGAKAKLLLKTAADDMMINGRDTTNTNTTPSKRNIPPPVMMMDEESLNLSQIMRGADVVPRHLREANNQNNNNQGPTTASAHKTGLRRPSLENATTATEPAAEDRTIKLQIVGDHASSRSVKDGKELTPPATRSKSTRKSVKDEDASPSKSKRRGRSRDKKNKNDEESVKSSKSSKSKGSRKSSKKSSSSRRSSKSRDDHATRALNKYHQGEASSDIPGESSNNSKTEIMDVSALSSSSDGGSSSMRDGSESLSGSSNRDRSLSRQGSARRGRSDESGRTNKTGSRSRSGGVRRTASSSRSRSVSRSASARRKRRDEDNNKSSMGRRASLGARLVDDDDDEDEKDDDNNNNKSATTGRRASIGGGPNENGGSAISVSSRRARLQSAARDPTLRDGSMKDISRRRRSISTRRNTTTTPRRRRGSIGGGGSNEMDESSQHSTASQTSTAQEILGSLENPTTTDEAAAKKKRSSLAGLSEIGGVEDPVPRFTDDNSSVTDSVQSSNTAAAKKSKMGKFARKMGRKLTGTKKKKKKKGEEDDSEDEEEEDDDEDMDLSELAAQYDKEEKAIERNLPGRSFSFGGSTSLSDYGHLEGYGEIGDEIADLNKTKKKRASVMLKRIKKVGSKIAKGKKKKDKKGKGSELLESDSDSDDDDDGDELLGSEYSGASRERSESYDDEEEEVDAQIENFVQLQIDGSVVCASDRSTDDPVNIVPKGRPRRASTVAMRRQRADRQRNQSLQAALATPNGAIANRGGEEGSTTTTGTGIRERRARSVRAGRVQRKSAVVEGRTEEAAASKFTVDVKRAKSLKGRIEGDPSPKLDKGGKKVRRAKSVEAGHEQTNEDGSAPAFNWAAYNADKDPPKESAPFKKTKDKKKGKENKRMSGGLSKIIYASQQQ